MSLSIETTYAVLNFLASIVDSEHQLERIRRSLTQMDFQVTAVFRTLDRTSSDCLTATDLTAFICPYNPSLTDLELSLLYRHLDRDGDGIISAADFVEMVFPCEPTLRAHAQNRARFAPDEPPSREVMQTLACLFNKEVQVCRELEAKKRVINVRPDFSPQAVFKQLDFFGEGAVSSNGIYHFWTQHCPSLTAMHVKAAFHRLDRDGDGLISFAEWLDCIKPITPVTSHRSGVTSPARVKWGYNSMSPNESRLKYVNESLLNQDTTLASPSINGEVGIGADELLQPKGWSPKAHQQIIGSPLRGVRDPNGDLMSLAYRNDEDLISGNKSLFLPKVYVGQLRVKAFDLLRLMGSSAVVHLFLCLHNVEHELEAIPPLDEKRIASTWGAIRISLETSGDNLSGTLPVIYSDGRCLSELGPILRFLSRKMGRYGSELWRDTTMDVVLDKALTWRAGLDAWISEDRLPEAAVGPFIGRTGVEFSLGIGVVGSNENGTVGLSREKIIGTSSSEDAKRWDLYDLFERLLNKSGYDFFTGPDLSAADLVIFSCIWDDLQLHGDAKLLNSHLKLMHLFAKIRILPGVKDWCDAAEKKPIPPICRHPSSHRKQIFHPLNTADQSFYSPSRLQPQYSAQPTQHVLNVNPNRTIQTNHIPKVDGDAYFKPPPQGSSDTKTAPPGIASTSNKTSAVTSPPPLEPANPSSELGRRSSKSPVPPTPQQQPMVQPYPTS